MRENDPICPLYQIACWLGNNCRYPYLGYSEKTFNMYISNMLIVLYHYLLSIKTYIQIKHNEICIRTKMRYYVYHNSTEKAKTKINYLMKTTTEIIVTNSNPSLQYICNTHFIENQWF